MSSKRSGGFTNIGMQSLSRKKSGKDATRVAPGLPGPGQPGLFTFSSPRSLQEKSCTLIGATICHWDIITSISIYDVVMYLNLQGSASETMYLELRPDRQYLKQRGVSAAARFHV